MRVGWPALIASLLLAGAPSAAIAQSDPAAVARRTGLELPEQLCGLARQAFGPHFQGGGLLAAYRSGDAWMDVLVIPANSPLAEEFEGSVRATHQFTPGLREIGAFAPPPGVSGAMGIVLGGRMEERPLVTGVLVWHRAGWRIKVLASARSVRGGPEWAGIECAIRGLGSAPAPA